MKKARLALILALLPGCGGCRTPKEQVTPQDAAPAAQTGGASRFRAGATVKRRKGDQPPVEEGLPPPPNRRGESVHEMWMSTDGTLWVAASILPGAGAPEVGAVYRRPPSGVWDTPFTKPGVSLQHVYGASSDDVWVSGGATLAHFDGKTWHEDSVAKDRVSVLHGLWGRTGEIWVAAARETGGGALLHRGKDARWTVDAKADVPLLAVTGAGASLWVAGARGTIMRRTGDGPWKLELNDSSFLILDALFATAENDIYAGGSGALLHSTGDGKWEKVETVSWEPRHMWGRNKADVYAGTTKGLQHFDGTTWTVVAGMKGTGGVVGSGDELFAAEDRVTEIR